MNFLGQRKLPNRFAVEFDQFRKFTFKERLCVLIGYNPIARVRVLIDKRDGKAQTHVSVGLTALQDDKAVIEELRKLDAKSVEVGGEINTQSL